MTADVALFADPGSDPAEPLLELGRVGYLALSVPTPSELERELASNRVVTGASLLIVIDVILAKSCVLALERCARQRERLRLPRPALVLAYEPGSLTTIARPNLVGCDTTMIMERPLALTELRATALKCRLASRIGRDADPALPPR